jgi:hypothetical protein
MKHILIIIALFAALMFALLYDLTHNQPSPWRPHVSLECSHYLAEDETEGSTVMVICKTAKGVQA